MRPMTPEERFDRIERQLEFLATHQAQLSASLETLREVSTRHDTQITRLVDVAGSLVRIGEEQGRRMEEGFAKLTESQRRTNERLNALINAVERYFSNGHK